MSYEITEVDVWAGTIEDRPGGLADKLDALHSAGANLEFVIARRAPDKPGKGVVFMAPIQGAEHIRAAEQAGLSKADSLHSLRLEGPDKPGLGAGITRVLADAGINLRGLSAAAVGQRCVVYFAFDSQEDTQKANELIEKHLQKK